MDENPYQSPKYTDSRASYEPKTSWPFWVWVALYPKPRLLPSRAVGIARLCGAIFGWLFAVAIWSRHLHSAGNIPIVAVWSLILVYTFFAVRWVERHDAW